MVHRFEKRRLIGYYRELPGAGAVLARAVAGLLIIAVVALLGGNYSGGEESGSVYVNAPRVGSGR